MTQLSKTPSTLRVNNFNYQYYSVFEAGVKYGIDVAKLPCSLKILLENLLRFEDGKTITENDLKAFATWLTHKKNPHELPFHPARVLMQDFTGVPAVVDLAAMRDAIQALGGDPKKINPLTPVDLVIDHSVQVDFSGNPEAFGKNVTLEMERNRERYELLRSAQQMFDNFRTVPPGTGICHQVNLEYLANVVWTKQAEDGTVLAYPDTVVGTDSHTTMINGLSVLGWGVGGIEAESAMLGQSISMTLPEVIGLKLIGTIKEGVTATDIVLTVTHMLRKKGVVDKFVEFFGPGLDHLSLANRATIANMAPEYGATCGFFPIDTETLKYLTLSGRDPNTIALVEAYAKQQGLWRIDNAEPVFTDILTLDLTTVEPCLAGPKRPQDQVTLPNVPGDFYKSFAEQALTPQAPRFPVSNKPYTLSHGDVVIAAITSCTNTSNPYVMLAAGLVAKKAFEKGIQVKPWVKTSLAPGSKVVSEYLTSAGLLTYLEKLGFFLVGYGCTTCIGNSGPLAEEIDECITNNKLTVASVLSGNRNFEGRIHQSVKANYLGSPPLVVAYALAGSVTIDISRDAIGTDPTGQPVYLRDIWPRHQEIEHCIEQHITPKMFKEKYQDVFSGDASWKAIKTSNAPTYQWPKNSTYIKRPPYFDHMSQGPHKLTDITHASILAMFGDSITTDHISPAGAIASGTPAALFLESHGVTKKDFNSYGARRGNDDVMVRGTFANIRIRNELLSGKEGGYTNYSPTGETLSIFDAAQRYIKDKTPLVIIAGKDYGMGSSRDWAAKGTLLLGVKAVICESFERIHRSNLVGMGVLPLNFKDGMTRKTLGLKGQETFDIIRLHQLTPRCDVSCIINYPDGKKETIILSCRIDTIDELTYFKNGGILHHVIQQFLKKRTA
jgi:aconitate hydratase